MAFGGGLGLYHVLGVVSCAALIYVSLGELGIHPLSLSLPSVRASRRRPPPTRRRRSPSSSGAARGWSWTGGPST
ncbi:hypothetical protein PR202_gb04779 [Eleusine coracana subsp. coracana]|uniref:Uncharacterized protein n=1 Tax=Eleusine coracana subsp. coracana TaxID=191504 RepID=A0AAV5E5D4_ELECO|nr:hypothetical protein PR202_gb04779 [Eleusine coracana subsp. coracana]